MPNVYRRSTLPAEAVTDDIWINSNDGSINVKEEFAWISYPATDHTIRAPFIVGAIEQVQLEAPTQAILNDVSAAKQSASSLSDRIAMISRFSSGGSALPYIVGRYYDASLHADASTTLAGAANRVEMSPIYFPNDVNIDQIGVAVSTSVNGTVGKCFIYESDAQGFPSTLLWEGSSDLAFNTTGYKFHSVTGALLGGRVYWFGVRHSGTATLRAINLGAVANLGLTGSNGTTYATTLRSSLTYATALPTTWSFAESQLTSTVVSSIRFRIGNNAV